MAQCSPPADPEGTSGMSGSGGRRARMRRAAVLVLAVLVLVVVLAVRWRLDADPSRAFLIADAAYKAGRTAEADAALRRLEQLRPPTSVDRLLRRGRASPEGSGPGPGGAGGCPRRRRRGTTGAAAGRTSRNPPRADSGSRGSPEGLADTLPARGPTPQGAGLSLQHPAPAGRSRRHAGRADGTRRPGFRLHPPLDQDAEHGLESQR